MDTSVQVSNRKICRTCLRHYESRKDLVSLESIDQTSDQFKMRFYDMLSSIMHQQIPENDTLPSKICIMCLSSLRVSFYFRLEVEKSQESLLKGAKSCGIGLVSIKNEPSPHLPVISGPRHVKNIEDAVAEMHSDDDEIIDYEPDVIMDYDDNDPARNESSLKSNISSTSKHNSITESTAFPCKSCDKIFVNSKSLQCHVRCTHSSKQCKYCQKKLGNRPQLKLHTKFKHAEKYDEFLLEIEQQDKYAEILADNRKSIVVLKKLEKIDECSTCELKFISKIALLKHHADCDSKCIDCGLKIPRKDFYFKHLENIHNYSSIDLTGYECPFCMNLFHTEKILQEHIQRLHPDENQSNVDSFSEAGESVGNEGYTVHQCKICSQSFQSSKSLKQHTTIKHKDSNSSEVKKSSNVRKYSKDEFFEKFLVKKSNDFFHCVPCRKDIFKRSILVHIKSKHAAIRCYRCELCPEAYFRGDYRFRHVVAAHSMDFKCFECDVQFDRAFKYEAHMTKHGKVQKQFRPEEGSDRYDLSHNIIQYIEDSSNYDYSNDEQFLNSSANNGQDDALDIPLTKDEFCDKYIAAVSDKNTVRCTICNLEIQKQSIISHLLWKHAHKKPLKCPFCNERVVKNKARVAHMSRCHPYEYKCSDCKQQFVKYQVYSDHVRDVHRKKVTSSQSTGEEDDLQINDLRFIANRNEDEIIEEQDTINISDANVVPEKLYGCNLCPKKFTSSKNLLIHKSHKHKNENVTEEIQEPAQDTSMEESMSFDEFKQNWVEVISQYDLKCLVCEQVMKKRSFGLHIKARHSTTGAFLCALCPERFYRLEQRMQHMAQCHRGIFHCTSCNVQFHRNSRYAKHMKDLHEIELDNYDNYEVDMNLYELKYVPFLKRAQEDDQISLSSTVNEPFDAHDPIEDMMQLITTRSEEMNRADFMSKYIKTVGNDRHCLACDKLFYHSSIYHHLIHFHSTVLPFKCPFCDVRFERSVQRSKHLQMFHPDEYKCNECGLQFQKHVKYSDHMNIEHNITVKSPKSPLEEEDLSSLDLKYVAQKSLDDTYWQNEEDGPIANSTAATYSEYPDESTNDISLLQNIKTDSTETHTISFLNDSNLVEIPPQITPTPNPQCFDDELPYIQFKEKYLKRIDSAFTKCIACNRILTKTSVCSHLRLWHATSMIYNCELCPSGFRRGDYRMRHMALQHPNNYKCSECGNQFYYSSIYKNHLFNEHNIKEDVPVLKNKDDIDVPLEKLLFAPFVPEEFRLHSLEETSAVVKRRASICVDRPTTSKSKSDPNIDGYTYREFFTKFIEKIGEMFKCKICSIVFSKLSIKKHIKRQHSTSKPYYCQLCDEGFFKVDDRVRHMAKNHPDSFRCLMCDCQFYFSKFYIDHMTIEHNMNVNIAANKTKEEVDVPFEVLRFRPQKRSEGNKTNTGHDGGDDGMTREEFTYKFISRYEKNGESLLHCKPCKKSFGIKQKMFHLYQNHTKVRRFGCDLCTVRFHSNFKRIKHMTLHHPNDFKCQMCSTQFESSSRYSTHMQDEHNILIKINSNPTIDIDSEDVRYYQTISETKDITNLDINIDNIDESLSFNQSEIQHCDVCNVDFDSSRSYRQHMRDHVGETDEIFEQPKVPEIKNEKEIPEKLFQCDMCEKKLSSVVARNMHRKFKHGIYDKKQKFVNQKCEICCEICEFTSFRRDYLEHHIRHQHGSEFSCSHCSRILSSFNCFIYHIETNHYTKPDLSNHFKCSECASYFRLEENLQKHMETKHGENQPIRHYYCKICSMDFKYPSQINSHLEQYTHKNLESFLNGNRKQGSVKDEPKEKTTINTESNNDQQHHNTRIHEQSEEQQKQPQKLDDNSSSDKTKADIIKPPENKRIKLSADESISDKMEYLKYLQTTESGHFKCGICGKIKALRKYMLHHLKQHKEVPTYNCDKCPEKFVFKSKYEQHIKCHENLVSSTSNATENEALIGNEHPKFQEIKTVPGVDVSLNKCSICNMTFKFRIILNKHNSTWHAEENPLKAFSMNDQKQKKTSSTDATETVNTIYCNICKETFPNSDELDLHKDRHTSNRDTEKTEIQNESDEFSCQKCSLKFQDKKYLENHQNFFCINRNQSRMINEQ